jgi:proteasome activator subunit 4
MGYIAENARKFFHPAAINEMLSTFLPQMDGTELDVSFMKLSEPAVLTLVIDDSFISILSHNFLATITPSILSPYDVSFVGVLQLLQV